jgi:hypothetical protein
MPQAAPQYVRVGSPADDGNEVSLLEILDNVLNSGVVIQGSIVLSLAGVDLVYVGLSVVLTSVETALRTIRMDENAKLKTFPRKGLRK